MHLLVQNQMNGFLNEFRIEDYMEISGKGSTSDYKFCQIFGYKGANEPVLEEDIITAIKFDKEGRFIALSDKAGRVIIFQNPENPDKTTYKLDYFAQFQSHFREFDPLRSENIDEEIVDLTWLSRQDKYLKLVTTNSKAIKLWKIHEKFEKKITKTAGKELSVPTIQKGQSSYEAELQKRFPIKHVHSILQVSESNHEQYLLSTDQESTFLWDLQRPEAPYKVCDLGESEDEEREVITCCKMHPRSDSLFVYGMSKGTLKMGDMRLAASSHTTSLAFKPSTNTQKNYLLNQIANISSATFTPNGKYIISRDYLTIKIWDIANNKKPLNSISLNDSLKSKLCQMVENESIYNKFRVSVNAEGNNILTGSYNNTFHLTDFQANNVQYELSYKKATVCRPNKPAVFPKMDYLRKVLVGDFNPQRNVLAVASLNCFFTYSL